MLITTSSSHGTGEALDHYLKSKLLLHEDRRKELRTPSDVIHQSESLSV